MDCEGRLKLEILKMNLRIRIYEICTDFHVFTLLGMGVIAWTDPYEKKKNTEKKIIAQPLVSLGLSLGLSKWRLKVN